MTDQEFERLISESVRQFGDQYEEYDDSKHVFSEDFDNSIKAVCKKKQKTKILRFVKIASSIAAVMVIGVIGIIVFRVNNKTNNTVSTASSAVVSDKISSNASEKTEDSNKNIDTINDTKQITTDNIGKNTENNTDIINKSTNTENLAVEGYDDLQDNAAEEPEPYTNEDSPVSGDLPKASENLFNISVTFKGQPLKIESSAYDQLVELSASLVADDDKVLDIAFTNEDIDSFKNNGYYIDIKGNETQMINVNTPYGETVECSEIIITTDGKMGYVFAITQNSESVYHIPDTGLLYDKLGQILNQ